MEKGFFLFTSILSKKIKFPPRISNIKSYLVASLYNVYEKKLYKQIIDKPRPRHIAVLCDGNRRWAKAAGIEDISFGYRIGANKVTDMLQWCNQTGVKHATVYLLSLENLQRDKIELNKLLEIIVNVVEQICLSENNHRVTLAGNTDFLPDNIAERIKTKIQKTKYHNGLHVNVAIGYGGRDEIVSAVKRYFQTKLANNEELSTIIAELSAANIAKYLYTSGQPDPDLVIRTSGEQRLSGFLLWQSAYSEIWFTEAFWPEFRKIDFLRALRDYGYRHRRFGK